MLRIKDIKNIEIWDYENDEIILDDTLYDLIKADMVERI